MTATYSPSPQARFYIINLGKAGAGCQLWSYDSITSAAYPTFKDSLGTANTNPVIMDDNGAASVWLEDGKAYKLVAKNAGGGIIYTQDDLKTGSATGPQGPQGIPGIQGPVGPTGPVGPVIYPQTPLIAFSAKCHDNMAWNLAMPSVSGQPDYLTTWWGPSLLQTTGANAVTCSLFNQTSRIFTATSSGRWMFSGSVSAYNAAVKTPGDEFAIVLKRAGAATIWKAQTITSVGQSNASVTMIVDILAGDQIYFAVNASGYSGSYEFMGVNYVAAQGEVGPTGPKGDKGDTGDTGATGATGTRGSLWYEGATVPGTITGQLDGDLYIRTTNDDVYQLQSGVWTLITNIKGATGPQATGTPTHLVRFANGTGLGSDSTVTEDSSGNLLVPGTLTIQNPTDTHHGLNVLILKDAPGTAINNISVEGMDGSSWRYKKDSAVVTDGTHTGQLNPIELLLDDGASTYTQLNGGASPNLAMTDGTNTATLSVASGLFVSDGTNHTSADSTHFNVGTGAANVSLSGTGLTSSGVDIEVLPDTGKKFFYGVNTAPGNEVAKKSDIPSIPSDSIEGTGTANSVPKFTAPHTIGNSSITDNGTTVAISEPVTITTSGHPLSVDDGTHQGYLTGSDLYLRTDTIATKYAAVESSGTPQVYLKDGNNTAQLAPAHDGGLNIQDASGNQATVSESGYYGGGSAAYAQLAKGTDIVHIDATSGTPEVVVQNATEHTTIYAGNTNITSPTATSSVTNGVDYVEQTVSTGIAQTYWGTAHNSTNLVANDAGTSLIVSTSGASLTVAQHTGDGHLSIQAMHGATPAHIEMVSPLKVDSTLIDGAGSAGTSAQILTATGTGTAWATVSATGDHKVLVDSADTTAGYLADKAVGGTGITVSIGNPGANEEIVITSQGLVKADPSSTTLGALDSRLESANSNLAIAWDYLSDKVQLTVPTQTGDHKVQTDSGDPTTGYISDKIKDDGSTTSVTTFTNPGSGAENLVIKATGKVKASSSDSNAPDFLDQKIEGDGTHISTSFDGTSNKLKISYTGGSGTVTSVSGSAPLSVTNPTTTPAIAISQVNTNTDGYLSHGDWNTFNGKQNALTLTTTGTSGAATLTGATLNIPNYAGGGGSTINVVETITEGNITTSGTPANANNGGSVQMTRVACQANMTVGWLTCQVQQAGSGNCTLGIYDSTGRLLAKTDPFSDSATGLYSKAITTVWNGSSYTNVPAGTTYNLVGGASYRFAIHSNQANNGAGFRGQGGYANNGVAPFTACYYSNNSPPLATIPDTLPSVTWTTTAFYVAASSSQLS